MLDGVATPIVDAGYKAAQRQAWDGIAGELRAWWPAFERFMAPVTREMLAHARLVPGAQVVDVATGFGEPALTVARVVGAAGRVTATDLSGQMLAVAAARGRAAGLRNVRFVEMDAETPTLAPGGSDAVMCRLGLMFLPDLDGALRRLAALLVPGGRLVGAVWGRPDANQWLTLPIRTLNEYLELPPPPRGTPGIFDLAAPGVVDGALAGAGLRDVRCARVELSCAWPSIGAYASFHQASPMRRLVTDHDPQRRTQAWAEVAAAAERRWGHGPLRLPGEIVVVSGRR